MDSIDSVYIWIRPNGILISRGESVEVAIKNLEKYYPRESLVETYKIVDYDGYYSPANIVLCPKTEYSLPKESVILSINTTITEWKRW